MVGAMRLHHLALRTRDLAALERFYAGVLGLAVTQRTERSTWLDAAGTIVMLERATDDEPVPAPGSLELTCFAITPAERAAAAERLAAAGVAIEAETEFTMYFRDPDGRRVGVSHHPATRISPA
jgi:catechol 2,3-dioxygenase-like lactoylglutathione lyase family enzyme